MVPSSIDNAIAGKLVALARSAIARKLGLMADEPVLGEPEWARPAATFVTLHQLGRLRGCIGSLTATQPLADDVRSHAVAAAFRDPRFPPLTINEWPTTDVEVSVLGPAQPLICVDEADLLAQLRPGYDGLTLEYGDHRATFLPQVWATLPDPADFVGELKRKAGLPLEFWSADLHFSVYSVAKFQ